MKKSRLQELAGVQLTEAAPKTTKENPLVYVWDSATSKDYPEQGLAGHMHLTTALKISGASQEGLDRIAKQLVDAGAGSDIGKGKRFKAFGVYVEYSKWNKKHMKESVELNEEDASKQDLATNTFKTMTSILDNLERLEYRVSNDKLIIAMGKLGYTHEQASLEKLLTEAVKEFEDFMPGLSMMREEDE